MKPIYLFTLMISISSIQISKAQSIDTIKLNELQQVIQSAIKNNPTQAVYMEQIKQATFNYKAAKSYLYPTISASFDGTDNVDLSTTPVPGVIFGKPGTTVYAQFGKKYVYNTGLTLNQDILNYTAFLQGKIASQNIRLTQMQQDAFVQSLKEQVARLYFSALIAKSALEIDKHDRLLADSVLILSRQKLDEGTTNLLSVNEAAINTNTIQQNQAQSQQLLDQSIENLKILLGAKPSAEFSLEENLNLDAMNSSGLTELGIDRTLAVYRQQADIASAQSHAQRSAAYPKISVSAFTGDQQFRDDFGLSFGNNAFRSYSYIGLNITVPLFTGFSNHYKYKSSVAQKNIAQIQFKNATEQSEINDRLLLKNYANYLQTVSASASSFKLYGQNVRLNQQKYKEGLTSLDVYMKAFQDYLTAENTYLNNLSQLLSIKSTLISRQ